MPSSLALQPLLAPESTPMPLAELMVGLACLPRGVRLLEPSAGTGALIHAAKLVSSTIKCTAIEVDPGYRSALRGCADHLVFGDFLELDFHAKMWPRIVAAPPRKNGEDRRHVRKMWDLLAPGGVAVVLASPVQFEPAPTDAFTVWLAGKVIAHESRALTPEPGSELTTLLVLSKPKEPAPWAL